jgi:hypothetical protein
MTLKTLVIGHMMCALGVLTPAAARSNESVSPCRAVTTQPRLICDAAACVRVSQRELCEASAARAVGSRTDQRPAARPIASRGGDQLERLLDSLR